MLAAGAVALVAGFQNCSNPKHSLNSDQSSNADPSGGGGGTTTPPGGVLQYAPASPGPLAGRSPSAAQVDLSWTDNSDNELAFRIDRSSAVAGPFTKVGEVIGNVVVYKDSGLQANTSYYYRVVATNAAGASAASNIVMVTTSPPASSPPSPPSALTATSVAATLIDLSWSDNSNNEIGFKIERSSNGGTTFTQVNSTSADERTYRDINLNPGTTYVYRVRATNILGDSAYTANQTATTMPAGAANTYTYVRTNVLVPNCVFCHNSGFALGGVSFADYNATVSRISKGNSANSRLYTVIQSGRMPPSGPMPAGQLAAIKAWIDAGGLNN